LNYIQAPKTFFWPNYSFAALISSKRIHHFLNLEISQKTNTTTIIIPIIAVYAPALKMSPTNSQEARVVDKANAARNK
jgi:hypothetical protein